MTDLTAYFSEARKSFHAALPNAVLRVDKTGVASSADRHSLYSVRIAGGIASRLGVEARGARLAAQMSGNRFEEICRAFLENTFLELEHLRPGTWKIRRGSRTLIASREQYVHLTALEQAARRDPLLAAALGSDYIVTPDIVITRETDDDATINARRALVDESYARLASLRKIDGGLFGVGCAGNRMLSYMQGRIETEFVAINTDRLVLDGVQADVKLLIRKTGRQPHVIMEAAGEVVEAIAGLCRGRSSSWPVSEAARAPALHHWPHT